MSTTEITNEQFGALFPEHDSRYIGQTWKDHTTPGYAANLPKQPVIRVSWEEANDFCKSWERKINAVSPFRQRHNGNGTPVQDRPVTSGSVTVKQTSASTKTWQHYDCRPGRHRCKSQTDAFQRSDAPVLGLPAERVGSQRPPSDIGRCRFHETESLGTIRHERKRSGMNYVPITSLSSQRENGKGQTGTEDCTRRLLA